MSLRIFNPIVLDILNILLAEGGRVQHRDNDYRRRSCS